ncbi:hypothetical protein [Erwinia mallotivora]|uniref:hypothetical protein n=1 Tax=Erwinia mallotivora TaxID=69222 RepID=UPI0021BE9248|nr:hypothetical protein [Erwinia mallotivora]
MKNSQLLILTTLCCLPVLSFAAGEMSAVQAESPAQTISNGKVQPPVKYATVWADEQGATHIGHCRFEGLEYKSYAPPSAPQWIGVSPDEVQSIAWAVLPPGYVGNWHHAPGPQWVVTLSGKWSVETTDGTTLVQGPGDVQFNADSTSHPRADDQHIGHITRTVGNEPNVQLIIKLKPGANSARTKGNCAS